MARSIEELAYVEAVRALTDQSRLLESLQSRAGTLLAAASLVTSFLGTRALGRAFDEWAAVATTAFIVLSLLVVGVLWPRHRWALTIDPRALLGAAESPRSPSVDDAYRHLALTMREMYRHNQPTLRRLYHVFRLASAFLVLEVVAWIASLV